MSLDSAKAKVCLAKACNEKYPKGLAHNAWKNLQKHYAKTEIFLAPKFRQELQIFKLKEESDTTELFEKIETIQLQASKITDDTILEKEICSKVISAAPKIYMPVIRNLQKENGSNL